MGRAGPAAPVLPEWIWLSVESPELSQRGAIARINNLLAVSGVPPIKRSYYQRHAARRKAQRLGLGSEEPAVKRPSTDDPANAARAEPAHAADYSPSDEPHSPSEGFVEGSSCVEEEPSASAVATAAARSCVSNGTYTHILTTQLYTRHGCHVNICAITHAASLCRTLIEAPAVLCSARTRRPSAAGNDRNFEGRCADVH
jgi:hypothetical protein